MKQQRQSGHSKRAVPLGMTVRLDEPEQSEAEVEVAPLATSVLPGRGDVSKADEYRKLAEEANARAQSARVASAKAMHEAIARGWNDLADQVDRNAQRGRLLKPS